MSLFFLGQSKIVFWQLLSDIRLFYDFLLPLCPPQTFSYIYHKTGVYSSIPNWQGKKKEKRSKIE